MNDKKEHLDYQIQYKTTQLDLLFTKKVFELQNIYNEKIEELIYGNEKLVEAFSKRDRATLDKIAQQEFDVLMKENPNFEVMCFGLPDMTSFYRAHMPKKYGDDISSVHGVRTVVKLKKRVSGFLISKLGLYYRVTSPVFKEGKFIGLIALGVNLGYANDHIYESMKTESAVLVETKQLKQSKWFNMLEEGSVGRYTVIATNGELIDTLKSSNSSLDSDKVRITKNGNTYNIVKKDIEGMKGKALAKVILFQDITKEVELYNRYMYSFISVSTLLVIVMIFVLVKTFNKFLSTIVVINDDLKDLNINLERKVEEEVTKNREKEKQLFEQAKMAQMGEMIGNIAHQWRQPLSAISSTASSVQLESELGILDNEGITKQMDLVKDKTLYLSNTINTFRDFIKNEKVYKNIVIEDEIEQALNIMKSALNEFNIRLENRIDYNDKTIINTSSGELPQVIINIMNNAIDILSEKDIQDPFIVCEIEKAIDKIVISIEDNGGGVPDDIIAKVFDPYFTTKHQSQGTGLGLHMSYTIVQNSLKGKLYVKNSSNGAKFYIELPL